MQPDKELPRIASARSPDTEASVMVASPRDAGFVSHAEAVGTVILPERFRAYMLAGFTLCPLQVAVGKELPRMAVVHLVFVGQRHVQLVLVQQPRSERKAAAAPLCIRADGEAHAGNRQDNRLSHCHSSSSNAVLNESADSTSS